MRVASVISCWSPNKSEISHKRRVFESYCKEARLQFKSPKRWYSRPRESNFQEMIRNIEINQSNNKEVYIM